MCKYLCVYKFRKTRRVKKEHANGDEEGGG